MYFLPSRRSIRSLMMGENCCEVMAICQEFCLSERQVAKSGLIPAANSVGGRRARARANETPTAQRPRRY